MPARVSVRCGRPWVCKAGLGSVLRVRRGTEETGGEGDDLVLLERNSDAQDETSCCLFIQCEPQCGEEIISLVLESQARIIEVYAGEEYLGTSRGEVVCTMPHYSADEVVTIHKTFLQMESPEPVCKVKLLSLAGRERVLIRGILVGVTAARPRRRQSFPAAGIDLDCVRTMVEGSPLSSGAQQLMNMVQLQQRNHFPFGDQLQRFLGKVDLPRVPRVSVDGLLVGSDFGSADVPFAKSGVAESQTNHELGMDTSIKSPGGRHTVDHRDPLSTGGDFKTMVASFLQSSATKGTSAPNPSLLPFLHSLCGEVNHMRIGEQEELPERSKSEESAANLERDQQRTCHFLEEIISKQMGAMEKRLLDHIDNRMDRLQELMDARMLLLADLLQSSHLAAGERLTNGDVHALSHL